MKPGEGEALNTNDSGFVLPEIRIRAGDYGRELERIWGEDFYNARIDGFYASDENRDVPRFSQTFALHGHAGLDVQASPYPQQMQPAWFGDGEVPKEIFVHNPPLVADVSNMTHLGLLSSDIEIGGNRVVEGYEDETPGTVDFFIPRGEGGLEDFLTSLRGIRNVKELITSLENDHPGSSALMFMIDTSRAGLSELMKTAMRDTDDPDVMFGNQFGMKDRIRFPMKNSGRHLAVPVGIPANYIEYIIMNSESTFWKDRMDVLRDACVCDGHNIPLVDVHSLEVIK